MKVVVILYLLGFLALSSLGQITIRRLNDPRPSNDDCTDAVEVELGTVYSGTNRGAKPDFPAVRFCPQDIPSGLVWYKVKGSNTGNRQT